MTERKCAECDKKLTGCSCNWRGTSDKKAVHARCFDKYERKLKLKKENNERKSRDNRP